MSLIYPVSKKSVKGLAIEHVALLPFLQASVARRSVVTDLLTLECHHAPPALGHGLLEPGAAGSPTAPGKLIPGV